jgi:hypothetical protein
MGKRTRKLTAFCKFPGGRNSVHSTQHGCKHRAETCYSLSRLPLVRRLLLRSPGRPSCPPFPVDCPPVSQQPAASTPPPSTRPADARLSHSLVCCLAAAGLPPHLSCLLPASGAPPCRLTRLWRKEKEEKNNQAETSQPTDATAGKSTEPLCRQGS